MSYREKPVLSQEEALQLHQEALVVDSQIPTITIGGLFTDNMFDASAFVIPSLKHSSILFFILSVNKPPKVIVGI